ncbi:tRNA (adenosine(37)-N6)-threonylcarbamoyltransferase complex dimerization subunit type 1 TsaB [Microbacterium koreense]|uniref:tRNA (Adenosine(37)-N6)-threonylcarbamoyltransferase complex dimerization subunit type 1 TsaB n=1 Tax=Microbacterium koreense TaxID=323761 RepID=A0ABW2ZUF2_9MICO
MILGIDTSLGTSVAVVELDGVVRSERTSANPLGHAEVIGDLLVETLADATLGPVGGEGAESAVEISHVAAGMGPGPFTGLRVGIAAARTFALGRDVPVLPVVSHDAAALSVYLADPFVDVPRFAIVTDARRREFAYTLYDGLDDDGLPVRLTEPALTPRDGIDDILERHGATRCDTASISAAMIALVAARAHTARREAGPSEPLYLRAPDVTLSAGPKKVGT